MPPILPKILLVYVVFAFFPIMTLSANPSNKIPIGDTLILEYKVRHPKDKSKKPPVLILLHGYGSNENDLFLLSENIPENWLIISAKAPIYLANSSFCWYHVKTLEGKITINFQQEEQSRKQILLFISQITEKYHADSSRVVLAGFSQGANMALCASLTEPTKISGFACFSGRFIEEIKPQIILNSAFKKLKAFIAHGSEDKMLPILYATENKSILQHWGILVTYSEDKTAHTISKNQLNDFLKWLNSF